MIVNSQLEIRLCKGTEAGKSACSGNREPWALGGGQRLQRQVREGGGLWVFAEEP